jgi:hypothetical protein
VRVFAELIVLELSTVSIKWRKKYLPISAELSMVCAGAASAVSKQRASACVRMSLLITLKPGQSFRFAP